LISFVRILISFISILFFGNPFIYHFFIIFLDALYRSLKLGRKFDLPKATDHSNHFHTQQLHTKIFYAQRNLYLTGFTLALSFIVVRYVKRLLTSAELQQRAEGLARSAAEKRTETAKYLKELDELRARSKDAEAALKQARAQQAEFDRLIDRCNDLEARLSSESSKDK
jgi:B-cell receptor-associated protein 31